VEDALIAELGGSNLFDPQALIPDAEHGNEVQPQLDAAQQVSKTRFDRG